MPDAAPAVIDVGKYARFAVPDQWPPGVDINANSAMVVTATSMGARGMLVTLTRQGKLVGIYPASMLVEVRAPS